MLQNVGGETCREKSTKTNEKEKDISRINVHQLLYQLNAYS